MKRVLLLCTFFCLYLAGKSQVVFNEFYTDPNTGNNEFFELYNTNIVPTPEKLDSYTIVVYYNSSSGTGFYVLDLPNMNVNPKSFFVGASASPFNVQGKVGVTANFSWNNIPAGGSLKSWKKVNKVQNDLDKNDEYDQVPIPQNFNDFFPTITGNGTAYAMMLFKGGVYVNGFLGGFNTSFVQESIKLMPNLFVDMDGGDDFTINWSSVSLAENTTANGGTDNGFIRKNDGLCGSWIKSTSTVTHTPGTTNGSAADLTGSLITSNVYNCATSTTSTSSIDVNVTGATGAATAANTLPVEVQMYYDNTSSPSTIGVLDGTDVYKESKTFSSFTGTYQSFVIPAVDRGQPVILVYKTVLGCFDKVVSLEPACTILPVSFSAFTAARNKQSVSLKWETATEQNNRGFYVQRNTKGAWENIAFVFSAANGGNSSQQLSYTYNDANNERGVSQYRIQQVDMDSKASYSVIRSIKGEGLVSKTIVYPNPSTDGKVNVVFEDQAAKAVTVSDMSGRVVRQYRSVVNNLQVDGLESGMYSIQVTDLSSGVSATEKVIIKKR